ncbi:unnamed protein product [Auanema sp. JU1783]|nr:unnamed protein product [Auanema sp. JU1783]
MDIQSSTTSSRTDCCPNGGLWSEWETTEQCTDTCGSCAQLYYTRVCLSDQTTCPCTGVSGKWKNCNIGACYYPRLSCCNGYTLMVIDGKHACGPQPVEDEGNDMEDCCPINGYWAEWEEWSACVGGDCGQCGTATRTRTCLSESYDCSCQGSATEERTCLTLASWTEWAIADACPSNSCGSCNMKRLTRTCNKENGCACIGSDERYEICNPAPCSGNMTHNATFACCTGFSKMDINGDGLQGCGPLVAPQSPPELATCGEDVPECCVIGGVWTEWSSGESCSDTCGYCGNTTRTRYCVSEEWDCPCSGPSTKQSECAPSPCLFPRTTCCGIRKKVIVDGHFECSKAQDSDPPASDLCWTDCCPASGGYWSEWSSGGACPDTCGSCAKVTQMRTCLTEQYGCNCLGPASRDVNCNIGVCFYPRDSCCAPYSSAVIDGKHACGPQPNYTTVYSKYDPYCNETCCPLNGLWAEWTITPNQCSDYCGACGNMTKTRVCLSEAEGCPCNGDAEETSQCNTGVCYYPRLSCCPGFTASVIEGKHSCAPITDIPEELPYINTCGVNCCPTDGIWGEWVVDTPCNDTCGSCGREIRTRKCLSLQYGCECTGDDTKSVICGIDVCLFPRTSCCPGFSKKINATTRTFFCGPLPTEPAFTPEQTTCCDPEGKGLWNEWKKWSTCTATCGLCGTRSRNRTCASADYGCPCDGLALETEPCGDPTCPTGNKCCPGFYLDVGYDGAQFCQKNPPSTCPGTWTAWKTDTGVVCNDTCGNCGIIKSYRYCWPSGCKCTGDFTKLDPCANAVCLFPREACCAPYKKKIVNKQIVCA